LCITLYLYLLYLTVSVSDTHYLLLFAACDEIRENCVDRRNEEIQRKKKKELSDSVSLEERA